MAMHMIVETAEVGLIGGVMAAGSGSHDHAGRNWKQKRRTG